MIFYFNWIDIIVKIMYIKSRIKNYIFLITTFFIYSITLDAIIKVR